MSTPPGSEFAPQQFVGADLHVSWADYHDLIERLAVRIAASGVQFNCVVGIARGGLRVADVLSRLFQVPMAVWVASSYRDGHGTVQGSLQVSNSLAMIGDSLGEHVLLVDDLADSGRTMAELHRRLLTGDVGLGVKTVHTAVLWVKAGSIVKPDFFVADLPHNPWIHQPFEQYDVPGALAKLCQPSV